MNRRTFLTSTSLGLTGALLPYRASFARPQRMTNYYVHHFDHLARLVPYYAEQSEQSREVLHDAALAIHRNAPKPPGGPERLTILWHEVGELYQVAFGVEAPPVEVGRAIHYLSAYKPPQRTSRIVTPQEAAAQDMPALALGVSVNTPGSMPFGFTSAMAAIAAAEGFEAGAFLMTDGIPAALYGAATANGLSWAAQNIAVGVLSFAGLALIAVNIALLVMVFENMYTEQNEPTAQPTAISTCNVTSSTTCGTDPGGGGGGGSFDDGGSGAP